MSRIPPALALSVALIVACGSPPPSQESPDAPAPRTLSVGRHQVRFLVPPGWAHHDHGRQQRFEKGLAHISLTDLGPVTREAIRWEIERSRDLFRRGQLEDARETLLGMRLRGAFPSENQWRAFERPWRALRRLGEDDEVDIETVEGNYVQVLAHVDAVPTRDFPTIADTALAELGHDAMRGVADRQPMVIDGRDALRLETWDRLSHTMRKSHLFVLNDGRLLVARMELGRYPEMQPAFDSLVGSLELPLRQLPGS